MRVQLSIVLAAAVALRGCATAGGGVSRALGYEGTDVQRFKGADGKEYRIFDKPTENKLMITPSLAASAGAGALSGLTLGVAQVGIDPKPFQTAATEFLISTGRSCAVTGVELLVRPQWEMTYTCSTKATKPR